MERDLERYLKGYARNKGVEQTEAIMSALGRQVEFVEAINTPGGVKLLEHISKRLNTLFAKIAATTATEKEIMEYNVTIEILTRWCKIITYYNRAQSDLINGAKQNA